MSTWSLASEWPKWGATIRIALARLLAYKLNFLLLVIGPVLVFFFIRYNLWAAIYHLQGITTLQGYTFEQMLAYQVWVMLVGFLGQGYNGNNLAEDIRLGRISAYLLYPFGFWQYHSSAFLAFQIVQCGVVALTLAAACFWGWVQLPVWSVLLNGFCFALTVGLFWFQLNFLLGILAFWLEETWVLRVMMVTITQFLSGALLPLELFPHWLQAGLTWLPFPYLTYVPVKILMGTYQGGLGLAYAVLLTWTLLLFAAARGFWRQGLRAYTAAGI